MMDRKPAAYGVDAAGAVVSRESDGYVVLIHRPDYDDWSLPKGKCDPGETYAETALREVQEETGITGVLGSYIGDVTYAVTTREGESAIKTVVYFTLKAEYIPEFQVNEEVDELRWLPLQDALAFTTYPGDRDVLQRYQTSRSITETH